MGHWKAECPSRADSASASRSPQVPATFVQVTSAPADVRDDGLPMEFVNLPSLEPSSIGETQMDIGVVCTVISQDETRNRLRESLRTWSQSQLPMTESARNDASTPAWRQRLKLSLLRFVLPLVVAMGL